MTILFGLFAAALAFVLVALFFIIRSLRRNCGWWYGMRGADRLYWHDCTACTGGMQSLSEDGWGPIPAPLLITNDEDKIFEAPLANARGCTTCHGMGGRHLPYPPKKKAEV